MADEDMFSRLQNLLGPLASMLPRAPLPYPGMRPAPGAMAGGNAFGGLPGLAQAGPPGMAGLQGQMPAAGASWMQPSPQQTGAIDWPGLIRLLQQAGIGQAPAAAASPLNLMGVPR